MAESQWRSSAHKLAGGELLRSGIKGVGVPNVWVLFV